MSLSRFLESTTCDATLLEQCQPCINNINTTKYNCSLPGLEDLTPGKYEGIQVNYLSFTTEISSPNLPVRAKELEACTGGKIAFAEAQNVWEDPLADLGSGSVKGFELYDGYFMSYSHFPEASARGLAETLNERIRESNDRLKWEDVYPKVRSMGEYRKNGKTDIDFLMYDGDFFVPIIRLDLLEEYNKPLPNTWEEVMELAVFFHGKDLNEDGEGDFGFCHFPRLGAGYWDWWWPEAVYSTWATYDQTQGIQEGFFYDSETMEPRTSNKGFQKAAEIWKTLWKHGEDGCITPSMIEGRCAIGFSPPGCWKNIFLNENGVHRKDADGNVVWQPTMKNGEYAEPYRFRPFGTTYTFDRVTGEKVECTAETCPKAEVIPSHGAHGSEDRASILPPSPYAGKLINRAPFYWSGGLGTLIRKSSEEVKKDFVWDFFVYTNSPDTSVYDVANYGSWLDSWRFSQLEPGDNFLSAGWSQDAYSEHLSVMKYALSAESNGALNLRIPALAKYTRDTVGTLMAKYIDGEITVLQLSEQVSKGWIEITKDEGKLNQLDIYRAALGLDSLSEVEKCRLHRKEVDELSPNLCKKYDDDDDLSVLLLAILIPVLFVILVVAGLYIYQDQKKKRNDAVWLIQKEDLEYSDPPEVLGFGTFGLVLLAEYRGTQVAVKRVIPPKDARRNAAATQTAKIFDAVDIDFDADEDINGSMKEKDESRPGRFTGSSPTSSQTSVDYSRLSTGDSTASIVSRSNTAITSQTGVNLAAIEEGSPAVPQFPVSLKVDGGLGVDAGESDRVIESGSKTLKRFDRSSRSTSKPFAWARFGAKDEYKILKEDFLEEMRHLSKLRHPCITTVMGAVIHKNQDPKLVMEYMDLGSLYDLIHNETVPIRGDVLLPMLRDIAQGMRFLHVADPPVIHGDLKAQNILVDNRFRAKVADFGLSAKKNLGACGTPFWMAPELLRGDTTNTIESDVYSFGIILYEVYSRKEPYEGENPSRVLRDVANPDINKRPPIPSTCPSPMQSLMTDSTNADPILRPSFEEIDLRLKRLAAENVEPSSHSYRSRENALLEEVFPPHIARALREGRKVEPEKRDSVTIFFSDIVGFTNISSQLAPEKISDMLDRLYTRFDALSTAHKVFKVETIGDAYMAVTNLVDDQPDHACILGKFAKDALKAARETLIDAENPSTGNIQIRVGLHSGPVVANVVGSRNPRYCLFGDSVNTASRMESNSIVNQIHLSESTAKLIQTQSPDLKTTYRGEINVKGKGLMNTYWLSTDEPEMEPEIAVDITQ